MGSSISTENNSLVPEGSRNPQRCRVFFWTRPIELGSSSSTASSAGSHGSGWACFDHWMVAFEYDDEVLLCDANDVEGELTGRCEAKRKEEFHRAYPKKKLIGEHDIPKEFVKERVNAIKKCGSYRLITNNCQKWLQDLMNMLGLNTSCLDTDAETVAFFGALMVFSVGTGYGIYKLGTWNEPKRK